MRKLINPRGRVVEVDEKDVVDLLKKGFLHVPVEEESMIYSQVHDKGPQYKDPHFESKRSFKREVPKIGDVLDSETV